MWIVGLWIGLNQFLFSSKVSWDCILILYDGDNYKDDYIEISGPVELADLSALGSNEENRDDEADSFKLSASAKVEFWSKPWFSWDKAHFDYGEENPDFDDIRSLKISCR